MITAKAMGIEFDEDKKKLNVPIAGANTNLSSGSTQKCMTYDICIYVEGDRHYTEVPTGASVYIFCSFLCIFKVFHTNLLPHTIFKISLKYSEVQLIRMGS